MAWTTWAAAAAALVTVAGSKIDPPPVMLDLGRLQPTPAPTAIMTNKKRLISVITVRNSADGDSVVTFEATDVAIDTKDRIRILAGKSYSLADEEKKPGAKALGDKILRQLRGLERDMLNYAELVGPPKQAVLIGDDKVGVENKPPE